MVPYRHFDFSAPPSKPDPTGMNPGGWPKGHQEGIYPRLSPTVLGRRAKTRRDESLTCINMHYLDAENLSYVD